MVRKTKCDLNMGLKYSIIGDQPEVYEHIIKEMWFFNRPKQFVSFNFSCRCGSLKVANFLQSKANFSKDTGFSIAYNHEQFDFLKKVEMCYFDRWCVLKTAIEDKNKELMEYFIDNFDYPDHVWEWIIKAMNE